MEYYAWKDSFNIGIEEVDRQHKAFLNYLNDCHSHVSGEKMAGIDSSMFDKLKVYAATHFRFEEEMMRKQGYPGLEQQQRQHRHFEAQIAELEAAYARGGEISTESVLVFLRDWFLKHILEEDKQLLTYVR